MGFMSTPQTGAFRLRTAVPFVRKTTAVARSATVAWIHEQQWYPCTLRFIDEACPQLPNTPVMLLVALRLANRAPAANVCQIFQHKRGFRVFRIRHKARGEGTEWPVLRRDSLRRSEK